MWPPLIAAQNGGSQGTVPTESVLFVKELRKLNLSSQGTVAMNSFLSRDRLP